MAKTKFIHGLRLILAFGSVTLLSGCFDREVMQQLNEDLGFEHHTPYIDGVEVMTIYKIKENGVFDRGGFKAGDKFIDNLSVIEFYKFVNSRRGENVEFKILRSGEEMSININIPSS